MFNAGKTRMIELPYGEKNYDDMLSRFHLIPERYGRTDRQTNRFAISISRVSMLTRDKKSKKIKSTTPKRSYNSRPISDPNANVVILDSTSQDSAVFHCVTCV